MDLAWMLPAIVVVPLLSAAIVGYFRNTWSKSLVSWVACGSVAISFALTVAVAAQYWGGGAVAPIRSALTSWGSLLDLGLVADGLSLWWALVVTGAGLLIHIYSTAYMREDESYGRFMAKMNFFIFAMTLLVLSDNFVGLAMGWGCVGLASYMLIGFYFTRPGAQNAAIKAFVMNIIGEAGLFAGIAFIYANFGSFKFDDVFGAIAQGPVSASALNLIGLLLLIGAAAKSAQLPLHTWLPYAMEGPTPVSALIHAATMVTAGVYLVSRAYPIYEVATGAAMAVAWIGGLGALFGALVAAGQFDIKRVLAFSTLSQIGYMFLANGLGAYVAADFHFFTHAFFKACLFLAAGIVVHHYGGDQDIRHMGGLWYRDRFAGLTFGAAALALIGLPPFAGFFSKDEILLAAYSQGQWALFAIAIVAAGLTAFYNVRLFSLVFLGDAYVPPAKPAGKKRSRAQAAAEVAAHAHGHSHGHDHATPAAMKWPVAILAVLSVVSGWLFFGHVQLTALEPAFPTLELHHESVNPVVAGLSVAVALAGGLISWYLYRPAGARRAVELDPLHKPGILYNMFYVDTLYDVAFVQPARATAEFVGDLFDPRGIDGVVNGLGALSRGLGGLLRRWQSGLVRSYVLTVFAGVLLVVAYYMFYV
ncbi:NADH-quinone oxidoreductase subunit L [Symbiobacterium thermophilum]|uniref:NADH-quinone oxidoreductase subunit L n=1 Tax=Symbiobacterium thermophilum TaxID=2734 RepID=UPI0035C6DC43